MEFWGETAIDEFIERVPNVPTVLLVGLTSSKHTALAQVIAKFETVLSSLHVVRIDADLPHLETLPNLPPCEHIIGMGGGKTLDIAKLLSLNLHCAELTDAIAASRLALPRRLPLTCIPTTCGSGSEATHFAVCYAAGKKHSIAHASLLPDHVVLAPHLVMSQSDRQTKIGALDALCQGVESMFSKAANQDSIQFSEQAVSCVFEVLKKSCVQPLKLEDYAELQQGAYWAGQAINITKTNVPHALSYHLTSCHNVPHGIAVAIFYENYLRFLSNNTHEMSTMQTQCMTFVASVLCGTDVFQIGSWTTFLRQLDFPTSLTTLAPLVNRTDLVRSVNPERLSNFVLLPDLDALVPAN